MFSRAICGPRVIFEISFHFVFSRSSIIYRLLLSCPGAGGVQNEVLIRHSMHLI